MTTWRSRGYLPHIDGKNLVQHITFHLADSLPLTAIERMQRILARLPPERQEPERRQQIQDLLDAGNGSCLLGRPDCAAIVQDSLLFGDVERYRLIAWTVMPNHVHVMIQLQQVPLAKIVQSWKRHMSRQIHLQMNHGRESAEPTLWHREYWDRYMRDDHHLLVAKTYIEENPVKAGLVGEAAGWRWGSAGWGGPDGDG